MGSVDWLPPIPVRYNRFQMLLPNHPGPEADSDSARPLGVRGRPGTEGMRDLTAVRVEAAGNTYPRW